uniref:tumor necrosis factor receptor superfamily member 1A n=1 Tax=Epinephelus lanceolatus TaxID=310571 RepID=UPI0014471B2E|nr:tumor necrosis factor receptor superfamily member 1A [Epinephelus lanceolatus]
MGFVLVFPLMLALLFTGQSDAEATKDLGSNSCYKMCPPGHEVKIKNCTFNSNVVCDCQEGYYYEGPSRSERYCRSCNCKNCKAPAGNDPDYKRKCQSCQRKECLEVPECKRKCAVIAFTYSTNLSMISTTSTFASASASTSKATSTRTTSSNNTSDPIIYRIPPNSNEMPWLILVVFLVTLLVTFLVLSLVLLLCAKNPFGFPDSCLCWRENKDVEPPVEDPKFNEQSRHQGSGLNMLTLTICEETPMMTQSPATPGDPAHITLPLPDTEHEATRQDEPSEHWPAIVLYAIIKEVPLRRWKEFLRLLSVTDQELERAELEASFCLGSMERQYQMLRLWSQRPSVSLDDVFSALHYMDLSGCAQLLQESLEKLQWRPELKQGVSAAMQDT